ncbi:MAG: Mur ligase family protein [Sulfurovaceae bacterium]|nr:Mur ligase family protein [Sulfurovaceae bacterium]
MMPTLDLLLSTKPLYYKQIDYVRIKDAFEVVKPHIKIPKVIHIVGTNGKGSTGRMISHLLYKSGYSVGHYSSPHILKFNERFWLNGCDCDDQLLSNAHERLYNILTKEQSDGLSYFEYTTLLALFVFEKCDYIVLEAGMGGEHDATNVVPKVISVITPIDYDHQAFLGNDISSIASTKLRSIDKRAVIAPQVHQEVLHVANKIALQKDAKLYFVNRETSSHIKWINDIAMENSWGDFLVDNAITACEVLDVLGLVCDVQNLQTWTMMGRYFSYASNVHIDVGHNLLAAKAIDKLLLKPVMLIYNTLEDKPYRQILELLKPKIKKLLIIKIDSPRALKIEFLENTLKELEISYDFFNGIINAEDEYLVFGSFAVVEAFLKSEEVK